jgi:hypothetical protein
MDFPSIVDGLLSDGISFFLETIHHSQRLESSKEANILKRKDDPLKIPKSNELGLRYSVQYLQPIIANLVQLWIFYP